MGHRKGKVVAQRTGGELVTAAGQRFVVASLGSIGKRHLRNLRALRPDATIAALRRPQSDGDHLLECDVQFVTLDDALAFEPTAVILAGPAPTHVPLAHAFVERGIPVLIEKPLSEDMVGLAQLVAAARTVPIMIGYNLRFNPSLAAMRKLVHSGVIGQVLSVRAEAGQYLPDWRPGTDYRNNVSARHMLGGGALLELSHEIDYVYWLFGMPDRVSCRGGHLSQLEIDVEDCVELCLEYAQPYRLVSIHLDFLQRTPSRSCKLIGSEGTIWWDGMQDRCVVESTDLAADGRIVHFPLPDRNAMYMDELAAFLESVEQGSAVPIPLIEGVDVMRIIAAARRSMASGRAEDIPSLDSMA